MRMIIRSTAFFGSGLGGRAQLESARRTSSALPTFIRTFASESTEEAPDPKKDFAYCVHLVRQRDREAYLCGMFLPSNVREPHFAIRALNVELASIKDGAHLRGPKETEGMGEQEARDMQLMAQKMRMTWWRDALAELHGENSYSSSSIRKHPVGRALGRAIQETGVTRRFLERLMDARQDDLERREFITMEEVIQYSEETSSNLLYLSLDCAKVQDDQVDAIASLAGTGIGLTNLLRSMVPRSAMGELSIPRELLSPDFPYTFLAEHVPPDQAQFTEQQEKELYEAVKYMAYTAGSYLQKASSMQSDIPKAGKTCFLPVVPSLLYLSKLKKADFRIYDPKVMEPSPVTLLAQLGRAWLFGVF